MGFDINLNKTVSTDKINIVENNINGVTVHLKEPVKSDSLTQTDLLNISEDKSNNSVFEGIPAARTLDESKAFLQQRKDEGIKRIAGEKLQDLPKDWKNGNGGFSSQADAKLTLGIDLDKINQQLATGKPYTNPGTDFLPVRKGDYDFALVNFTSMIYRNWDNPNLKPEARLNLVKSLYNQEGKEHLPGRWLLGIIPETENHLLMTESSRYLKNQIVQKHGMSYSTNNLKPQDYDNSKNGFNDWFINHLSQFTRNDFDEYNSKPYQPYAEKAVQNLYDYADDPKVKTSSQVVLDYLSAKFALQSSDLRRVVPYRRRPTHTAIENILKDNQSSRYMTLAGNFNSYDKDVESKNPFSNFHMYTQGVSKYEVPDAILDIMVNKSSNPYFMTSNHENTEIIYAENNFLISAGGRYQDFSKIPFTSQEDGIVMPTVVMLKDSGPNVNNMMRFLGRGDKSDKKNNTGVYENFAFGIRPTLPDNLNHEELKKQGKLIEKDNFKFIDLDNVYMAVYTKNQASPENYAPSVGFTEVVDKKSFTSLQDFEKAVEKNNQDKTFNYYGSNTYTTTKGKTIEFEMAEPLSKNISGKKVPPKGNVEEWTVKKVMEGNHEIKIDRKFENWQLTDSHTVEKENDGENNDFVMKADGTGQVLINNPRLNKSLLMSLADHKNPIRIEQDVEAINLTASAILNTNKTDKAINIEVNLKETDKVGYLSLKWAKGSSPENVKVYIKEKNNDKWKLAENRDSVFTSKEYDFRTDFNLTDKPDVSAVKFVASGKKLNLVGNPEAYQTN